MKKKDAIEKLRALKQTLPPFTTRKRFSSDACGGAISPKYLANLSSLGQGPPTVRIGKMVMVETDGAIEWLINRVSTDKNERVGRKLENDGGI